MSIASQISRLTQNVSDALDAIEAKGVTIPSGSNSDDLADLIGEIQQGGSYQEMTVTPTTSTQVIVPGEKEQTQIAQTKAGANVIIWSSQAKSYLSSSHYNLNNLHGLIAGKTYRATGSVTGYNDRSSTTVFTVAVDETFVYNGESFVFPDTQYNSMFLGVGVDSDGIFGLFGSYSTMEQNYNYKFLDAQNPVCIYEVEYYDALSQVTVLPASGGAVLITDTSDAAGGTVRTITAITVSGTKTITQNGTGIDVAEYAAVDVNVPSSGGTYQAKEHITPTESSQTITPDQNYDALSSVQIDPISSDYVGSNIPRRTYNDISVSGPNVTVPAGFYASQSEKSVASGTEGTPTVTKGTVSNHQVSVTPSVTNTAGYISGGTKNGTAVTVSASELVSGSETKTDNGTYDVTNLASLTVAIPIQHYYTGSSTPSSSLGENGDIYLQT